MTEESQQTNKGESQPAATPVIHVAPSPHLANQSFTTRRMMLDVIIALLPVLAVSLWVFRWYAVTQIGICVGSCLVAEWVFTAMRGKKVTLGDFSAIVTGLILAFSLPGTAPWYVGVVGSVVAIGIGKVIFGGLGMNIFNPAMVGRAFVMIAFTAAMGATAYEDSHASVEAITQATPMAQLKEGTSVPLENLLLGNTNGSLGETGAIACIIGGLYLCLRRTAAWQIPAGAIGTVAVISVLIGLRGDLATTVSCHLAGGALLLGAFFIITDPVTSPITPKGRLVFGIVFGALVMLMRTLSAYPEGVMFAVLLANALAPLINRWTIPTPVGGPVPERK